MSTSITLLKNKKRPQTAAGTCGDSILSYCNSFLNVEDHLLSLTDSLKKHHQGAL
jgi:hypothetical protein